MNKRKLSCVCFFSAALLFISCIAVLLHYERHSCAGIRILSETEYSLLSASNESFPVDLLMQNDYPASMDSDANTVYISINAAQLTQPWRFSSVLSIDHPEYTLCFAPDPHFSDMENAVKESHPFNLLIIRGDQFAEVSVIFTTLPILQLSTDHYEQSDGRYHGTFTLKDPYALQAGYSIADSQAEWHLRGGTSRYSYKPPYKITLKKQDSIENNNLSLLQLGEDDDWILNSMVRDDVKLREMVISALWNSLQEAENSTLKMSEGKYVEVFIDGRYSGLYMLQRRVDNKYLGENHANDVILKGNTSYHPASVDTAYRIQFNPANVPSGEIFDFMTAFFYSMSQTEALEQVPAVDIKNWININAFMSAFHLIDNVAYKNMYYLLHKQSDQFVLQFILWDVDMSVGIGWAESGFIVDLDRMFNSGPCLRSEAYTFFELDPTLKNALAQRWQQLRTTTLSTSNIENVIYSCNNELVQSGALIRDQAKNGLHYDGEDTLDRLLSNLNAHLERMDDCYQEFLISN